MIRFIIIILIPIEIFTQDINFYNLYNSFNISDNNTTDTVWAGTYKQIVSGASNRGASNSPDKDIFFFGHTMRLRQNGTITRVQLYCGSKIGLTGVYIKVWRKNGYSFDLVGVTNNIVNNLDSGQISTINLTEPIVGVHEGDYYSILLQNGNLNFFSINNTDVRTYYTNSNPTGNYNWYQAPLTDSGYNIIVRFYMSAPNIVYIGNSIISGYYQHKSYLEIDTTLNNIPVTIPFKVSDSLGWIYQNMAVGGQFTSAIRNRFKADVLDLRPDYVLIEGGINDIINNVSSNSIISNFEAMLDSCTNNNIKGIVILIQPMSVVSNSNMLKRDSINTRLIELCNQKNQFYVDVGQQLGVRRDTGTPPPPPGNLWNLNPIYSSGDGLGIHLNTLGNTVYSSAVLTVIRPIILGWNQQQLNVPSLFYLSVNYPNPFNPVTTIKYGIPKAGNVTLKIYDIIGREAAVLVNETKQPGFYTVDFDASNYASGIYLYKIEVSDPSLRSGQGFIDVKKMILLK